MRSKAWQRRGFRFFIYVSLAITHIYKTLHISGTGAENDVKLETKHDQRTWWRKHDQKMWWRKHDQRMWWRKHDQRMWWHKEKLILTQWRPSARILAESDALSHKNIWLTYLLLKTKIELSRCFFKTFWNSAFILGRKQ